MDAIERLRAAVKASGMKQAHIARVAGMPAAKLNKILKGWQVPTVPDFIAIARAINLDPARLFSDGELVVKLEEIRVAHAAATTIERTLGSYLPETTSTSVAIVPLAKPASAMTRRPRPLRVAASSNVELFPEVEEKRKQIPRRAWNRGARMIARAIGDSMSGPDGIADGELVYLKPTRSARNANGHIVVCRAGEAVYLKKLEIIGRKIRLISINPDHEEIELGPADDFQVIGIVVDQHSRVA